MPPKRVQLMSVGRREQRFAKLCGDRRGPTVQIEKPLVEMTKLDRVEAIDFIE